MIALTVVLPVSGAILPDPLWIGGVYDGGDTDDLLAVSADFHSPGITLPLLDRSAGFFGAHPGNEAPLLVQVYAACRPRGPPPRAGDQALHP